MIKLFCIYSYRVTGAKQIVGAYFCFYSVTMIAYYVLYFSILIFVF